MTRDTSNQRASKKHPPHFDRGGCFFAPRETLVALPPARGGSLRASAASAFHKPKNPGYLLQGIRGFPLKKRIKMKRTVSCRFYNTGKILTNPTPVVTKELNHIKTLSAAGGFLAIFATFFLHREKGRRSDPSALQKMEDRMKRCSCLASMSIDKRFYKSSRQLLQKL